MVALCKVGALLLKYLYDPSSLWSKSSLFISLVTFLLDFSRIYIHFFSCGVLLLWYCCIIKCIFFSYVITSFLSCVMLMIWVEDNIHSPPKQIGNFAWNLRALATFKIYALAFYSFVLPRCCTTWGFTKKKNHFFKEIWHSWINKFCAIITPYSFETCIELCLCHNKKVITILEVLSLCFIRYNQVP